MGLFSKLGESLYTKAEIKNIKLESVNIINEKVASSTPERPNATGGLVGYSLGKIKNCSVTGRVINKNGHIGGLVGVNDGTIENCSTNVEILVDGDSNRTNVNDLKDYIFAGGIAGISSGSISNSFSTGNVESKGTYTRAGGLVGLSYAPIKISYAKGSVRAIQIGSSAGGLVGELNGSTVENSYAAGSVEGEYIAAGLVAMPNSSRIINCYAIGNISSDSKTFSGGLVGNTGSPTIINSYYNLQTTGKEGDNKGAKPRTVVQMKQGIANSTIEDSEIYTGWITDIWNFRTDDKYPILIWQNENDIIDAEVVEKEKSSDSTLRELKVNGKTIEGFDYKVQDYSVTLSKDTTQAPEVVAIANDSKATVKVSSTENLPRTTTVIVVAEDGTTRTYTINFIFAVEADGTKENPFKISSAVELQNIKNIDTKGKYFIQTKDIDLFNTNWTPYEFNGFFDGQEYKITNLNLNKSQQYVALFSKVGTDSEEKSELKNINLENVSVKNSIETYSYTAGLVGYLDGMNTEIKNSYVTGTIEGSGTTGGLVGQINKSIVQDSYSTAKVIGGSNAGGLVGYGQYGSIKGSFAAGDVESQTYGGGLVGSSDATNIVDTYAQGSVWGKNGAGGLVGNGAPVVQKSYAVGSVTSDAVNRYKGGLVGYTSMPMTISNSYYDKDTTGQNDTGKGKGVLSLDMKSGIPSTSIYNRWSTDIWDFGTENDYPVLIWEKTGHIEKPELPLPNQNQSAPKDLVPVAPTAKNESDGKITGIKDTMEYRLKGDSNWIDISKDMTEITGLKPGIYEVRYAARKGYNVGEKVEVTVNEYKSSSVFIEVKEGQEEIILKIDDTKPLKEIEILGGTSILQLKSAIKSTDGSKQAYEVVDGLEYPLGGTIETGHILQVTAEDGKAKTTYRIVVTKVSSNDPPAINVGQETQEGDASKTDIKVKEGFEEVVLEIDNKDGNEGITIAEGIKVKDLLDAIKSLGGYTQKYTVIDFSGQEMSLEDDLEMGYLLVKSHDEIREVKYMILSW